MRRLEIDLNEYLGGCECVCMYVFMICSSFSTLTQPETPLFTPLKRRLIFSHFNMFGATKPVGVSFFPQRNSARLWFQCLPTESPKIRPSRSVSAYTPLGWCLVDVCSPHTVCVSHSHYSVRKFSTLLTISVSIAPNTRSLTAAQSFLLTLPYQILV